MKKIILFRGGVETQGFFSVRLEKRFRELGHDTFMFDYQREASSSYDLLRFFERGNTVMLTFNFHGLCNEDLLRDEKGIYIWEDLGIPCINIVVDHPFYYDRFMNRLPKDYTQISIDKNHEDYLRRFYPHIKRGPFLPLGGTCLNDSLGPFPALKDRDIDIIMTGSWADPAFYEQYMHREGSEYSEFYRRVLDEQLRNTSLTFEEVFEPMIKREAQDTVTDDALRKAYSHLVCFDMYVRYYYRGLLIKLLADSGLNVLCVGGGWDHLPCKRKENISHIDYTTSLECLKLLRRSRISVNVMPWFKRGAHDRIFNSMLSGSLCLTDSSLYLDTILKDGANCLIYSLDEMEKATGMVREALADTERAQRIADEGFVLASSHHTWENRADTLHEYIESDHQ